MNIFVLDESASTAAACLHINHLSKMILESTQILSDAFPEGIHAGLYRRTNNYNHPCSEWARKTKQNWEWAYTYGYRLCQRFELIYGKPHKCREVYRWMAQHYGALRLSGVGLTPFAPYFPLKYLQYGDSVSSYRLYYIGEKLGSAQWESPEAVPHWIPDRQRPCWVRGNT